MDEKGDRVIEDINADNGPNRTLSTGGTGRRRSSVAELNMHNNVSAKVSNPLSGIPKDALLEDVAAFAQETGLSEHLGMLQKGALVAQNPGMSGFLPQTCVAKSMQLISKTSTWRRTKRKPCGLKQPRSGATLSSYT
jgi:hypothetical protein